MLKFYMTPGSCSTGIHILLEELDLLYEVYPVNLLAGDNRSDSFRALNAKATIPLLVTDDGRSISEYQAIAWWLARSFPKAGLLPDTLDEEIRVLELMDYVVGTLHGHGFTRIFTSDKYALRQEDHEPIQQQGKRIVNECFSVINDLLSGKEFVSTDFSIADTALFYPEFWAVHSNLPLPPHCIKHFATMLKRPAVRRVLYEEGYNPERMMPA